MLGVIVVEVEKIHYKIPRTKNIFDPQSGQNGQNGQNDYF